MAPTTVQRASNTAVRQRFASTTHHVVLLGTVPQSLHLELSSRGDWQIDVLGEDALRQNVTSVVEAPQELHERVAVDVLGEEALRQNMTSGVEAPQELHERVAQRVEKHRDPQKRVAIKGQLQNFEVGDYVRAARMGRLRTKPKLVSMWTGPWRIVTVEQQHGRRVQSDVTDEAQDRQVARLRSCVEKELEIVADLKEVFQHTFAKEEFDMAATVGISEDEAGNRFKLQVACAGFGHSGNSREPLEDNFKRAPQSAKSELHKYIRRRSMVSSFECMILSNATD